MNASVSASEGLIEWLGSARGDAASLGGKAASLDRLARLGFTVPPGFCLTPAAFDAHLAAVSADDGPTATATTLADPVARQLFLRLLAETPPPPAVGDALSAAVAELLVQAPPPPVLAVRSSAIGEDGEGSSFAGLHETVLGLAPDGVDPAVRRCWSSLWNPVAVAYRQRRGWPLAGARMAVVVQALVPAEASAVVFTRHPVTGRDDVLLINAVRGLGEPMVSGTVTPDTIVVDKATRATLEFTPGDRGDRLLARDGTVTRAPDPATGPALEHPVLNELVDLSIAVERAFGAAVDIEAAYAGDHWYLLQARPITTR